MNRDTPILTEEEAIHWLRIEAKHPSATMKYYREKGLLHGVKIGRHVRYPLWELEAFVKRLAGREEC